MDSTVSRAAATLRSGDLYDRHPADAQVLEPMLRHYGGSCRFFGTIETLRVFEDNVLVRRVLEQPGRGRILVIDGGGSVRRAISGDAHARLALANNWTGVVVYGAIRGSRGVASVPVGMLALATQPIPARKEGTGCAGDAITFGGVAFRPGAFLFADEDGVIVLSHVPHEFVEAGPVR
jgi:regulator of ribonuclease activity A